MATGQLLSRAASYLQAARLVVDHGGNRTALRAPLLHLFAHGLEVLLKSEVCASGVPVEELRTRYGHDLRKLWRDKSVAPLRLAAQASAKKAWRKAGESGAWPMDDFSTDPICLLDEHIDALSFLHTRESEYALRYIMQTDQEGPVPLLLLETFEPVVQDRLRESSQ